MSAHYEKLIEDFKKLVLKERLSHAYLFSGGNESDREAKFSFAEALANFLEKGEFERPSNYLIERLVLEKSEEEGIGIDSVRFLKHFLSQQPILAKFRTVIIKDAEVLTLQAQNALLKIVEEPPPTALVILIVRNEESLFPTLISRLQRVHFSPSGEVKVEPASDWKNFSLDEIIEKDQIDQFFELLLADIRSDPIRNCEKLKAVLKRLTVMKQFNTNKRLQLRTLASWLS